MSTATQIILILALGVRLQFIKMNSFRWTNEQIRHNDFIFEEEEKESHWLTGYHVCKLHVKLYNEEQLNIISISSDSSSDDGRRNGNTSENIIPWSQLSENTKAAWKERAYRLNVRKILGSVMDLSSTLHIDEESDEIYSQQLKQHIEYETSRMSKVFRSRLAKVHAQDQDRIRINRWGGEYVRVGSHLMLELYMPSIMKQVLFGNNFDTIDQSEIKRLTKKTCLIHIPSSRRMNELFQVNDLKLGEARTKEYTYYYCGKIILRDKRRNSYITAYVQDESSETLILKTRGGRRMEITKPWYSDANSKKYYGPHGEYTRYTYDTSDTTFFETLEYYPIRIFVSHGMRTNFRMIAHRYVVKRLEPNVIVERLCTCKFIFIY